MPIYLANINEELTIRELTGNDKVRAHLTNLGFIVGETVKVINKVDDNVIVRVKDSKIALSHDLARRILV